MVAQQMVNNVAEREPRFNDYTGNLVSSYSADVFIGGDYSPQQSKFSKLYRGEIEPRRGRNRAKLRRPPRHGARIFRRLSEGDAKLARRKGVYEEGNIKHAELLPQYRYLKPWERQSTGGYRQPNEVAYRREARKMARDDVRRSGGTFTARSYILITNKAPYADFVQRGSNKRKHYNVLRGGLGVRSLSKYNMLLKQVTLKEIEEALRTNTGQRKSFESRIREKYTYSKQ